jgi:hypothetical protein
LRGHWREEGREDEDEEERGSFGRAERSVAGVPVVVDDGLAELDSKQGDAEGESAKRLLTVLSRRLPF